MASVVSVARRFTRVAGTPISPSWTTGQLAGRAEIQVVSATSPDGPRWWTVVLDALTGQWDGQAFGGAGAMQGGDSWARIAIGDGVASPIYVSWPGVGGSITCYGAGVEVFALPMVSAMNPLEAGPSWAATIIGDDLPPPGNRSGWLGLGVGGLTGIPILPLASTTLVAPPYARRLRVKAYPGGTVILDVEQLTSNGAFLVAFDGIQATTELGALTLDPRCARVRITNTTGTPVQVVPFWEVQP